MHRSYALIVVASRPPPIAGQSLATRVLEERLAGVGLEYGVVDLSREFYTGARLTALLRRAVRAASLPAECEKLRRRLSRPALVYLQLGQSTQALLRDLPILAWAAATRRPTIVHVHGGGFRRAFDEAPQWLRRALRPLLARVRRAIVLSPMLETMFDGILPPERVVSVANSPEASLTESALQSADVPSESGVRALYLSNLIDSKGYVTVLETARLAQEQGLDASFILAGAKTEMGSVDPSDFIASNGLQNVEYVGSVHGEEKLALLARSTVFVLPTAYPTEGQPISILEAMQFGLPVITTRQGGISDVIRDGQNGVIVEANRPSEILTALSMLGGDSGRARKMSEVAQADGLTYTAEKHGEEMLGVFDDVYEAVLSESPNSMRAR